jgi:hypothetical protein
LPLLLLGLPLFDFLDDLVVDIVLAALAITAAVCVRLGITRFFTYIANGSSVGTLLLLGHAGFRRLPKYRYFTSWNHDCNLMGRNNSSSATCFIECSLFPCTFMFLRLLLQKRQRWQSNPLITGIDGLRDQSIGQQSDGQIIVLLRDPCDKLLGFSLLDFAQMLYNHSGADTQGIYGDQLAQRHRNLDGQLLLSHAIMELLLDVDLGCVWP